MAELQLFHKGKGFVNRKRAELIDAFAADRNRENFVLKTPSLAFRTGNELKKFFIVFVLTHIVALLNDIQNAFELDRLVSVSALVIPVDLIDFVLSTVEESVQAPFLSNP